MFNLITHGFKYGSKTLSVVLLEVPIHPQAALHMPGTAQAAHPSEVGKLIPASAGGGKFFVCGHGVVRLLF